MNKNSSVIIIGAGPAGIAAGTKLYENGIKNIIWLEAENRIGGRINTIKFAEYTIDIGAQWCHGAQNNIVYEMANPLGLLASPNYSLPELQRIPDIFAPSGEMLSKLEAHQINQAIDEICNDSDIKNFNGCLGDFIKLKFLNKLKNEFKEFDENLVNYLLDWVYKNNSIRKSSDSLYELSAKHSTDFLPCKGDDYNWKGRGYKTILDLMLKKLPDPKKALPLDDKILLNKEVVNIIWNTPNQNGVIVKCADNSEYKADYVIVTVSVGVLKDRINSLFLPDLPEIKLNAIKGIKLGTLDKLIFEFSQPWWPKNHSGFTFAWKNGEIEKYLQKFNGSLDSNKWLSGVLGIYPIIDHQPNLLLGWISGEAAQQMETISEDEVKTKVMQLIRMFLEQNYDIPEPVNFTRSKWFTNPHFHGSYSSSTIVADKLNSSRTDLEEPLKNSSGIDVVLFAGEATSSHRYSTVDGAIESGWREAERLLKIMKV